MQFKEINRHARTLSKELRPRFEEIAELICDFCERYLNDEYRDAALKLTVRLCREHEPALRGRAGGWAAGVLHALADMNFLADPEFSPCVTLSAIAESFGVAVATMRNKSRLFRDCFQVYYGNPQWRLEHAVAQDFLVWTHIINGKCVDLREEPRDVQQRAAADGLIPYVYADRYGKPGIADKQIIARIGPEGVVTIDADLIAPDNLGEPLEPLLSDFDDFTTSMHPQPPAPKRTGAGAGAKIFVLKISIQGSNPSIYRRLAVPGDIRLSDLHDVIQAVMGWEDYHLHEFRTQEDYRFGDPEQWDGVEGIEDEYPYRLLDLVTRKGDRFIYHYDFGDDWIHRVNLERIVDPDPKVEYPVCLSGKRACPPEDCGGIWGFYDMLESLQDPADERYEELCEWLPEGFDPDVFDLEQINLRLAHIRC